MAEYANVKNKAKHLRKRQSQGYDFNSVEDMERYGQDFFNRTGDDIIEFTDETGYLHRLDNATQEYGILQPDKKVQSVFKVKPNAETTYKNGLEYMEINMQKYNVKGQ